MAFCALDFLTGFAAFLFVFDFAEAAVSLRGEEEGGFFAVLGDGMEKSMEAMPGMMTPDAVRQDLRKEMDAYIQTLTRQQQREIRSTMRGFDTQRQRARYITRLLDKSKNYKYWNAKQVFDDLAFKNAGECVNALVNRFLAIPISRDQQALIAEALGAQSGLASPLNRSDLTDSQMNAALHLLLSTAEYQLT